MRIWLILLLIAQTFSGHGQELPPVNAFETDVYHGGSQNWMLGQDENQFIYAANNLGLLEYNGHHWTLYPSPNETIIRSVTVHNGLIYTGNYMDFGYWSRQPDGRLTYHSLSASVSDRVIPDEQFWNIIVHEEYVIFQSLHQLFLYRPDTGEISAIPLKNGILKVFTSRRSLYFTDQQHRLFRLEAGQITPLLAPDASAHQVVHLWEEGNSLLVQTAAEGCFLLEDGYLVSQPDRHAFLADKRIYSALRLRQGGHVFGTISNGLFITDPQGQLRYHLHQINGLTNNTILALFEDEQHNIWAGTDNGINCINLYAPFRKYTDNTGQLGTVYASAVYEGNLYLGSNQGLFVKRNHTDKPFALIPGTRGQVWSLYQHNGYLFCGHDAGTFLVNDQQVTPLSTFGGTWTFVNVPEHPDLLLQGGYYGLSVLEQKAGKWQFRNKVEGFGYSARFMGFGRDKSLYVSHEYRGVYGLKLDAELRRVVEQKAYDKPAKGRNAGLISFQGNVYYLSRQGIQVLQDFERGFSRDSALNDLLEEEDYTSGRMTDTGDRMWFFNNSGISFFHQGTLSSVLQRQNIPVSAELINAKAGYENISLTGRDSLLIGTADGYLVLDLRAGQLPPHKLHLTKATSSYRNQPANYLPLEAGGEIPYKSNNVALTFAVTAYSKYFAPQFQYRLEGIQETWSEWSAEATVTFPNLPYGSYTLEARSLLGQNISENTVTYAFQVLRPWYASHFALALYLVGFCLLIYLLHRAYTRYYRRKQRLWLAENEQKIAAQQREAELQLSRINNQQLQQDIESKNREMAISTMNLVKKNELLQQIKDNLLAAQKPEKNIKDVISTINKNIDEAETWNLFKDAFENADQDFFKKIKELHPELTPNDLKLCAYLRLNLSSKEIAPMLNISVRSVEVKRYRLRKKMDLEHEAGLVEYILNL